MSQEPRKQGRPKSPYKVRDSRMTIFLTKEDHGYLDEVADNLGFKSTPVMVSVIMERLCEGGFSALGFAKLGWQVASLPTKRKRTGYYLDLRPPAPLLPPEPDAQQLAEHLEEVKKEIAEENRHE